jgi:hypothetical protein
MRTVSIWLALFLAGSSVWSAPATRQTPTQAATPAECVEAARALVTRRRAELRPLTTDKVNQIEAEKRSMAAACAAPFEGRTLGPDDALAMVDLYAELGDTERADAQLAAVLARPDLSVSARGRGLALAVVNGLREPKSEARNQRLENLSDALDRLGPEAAESQSTAHMRLNGYYRGDDIDAGIIKHSTWLIDYGRTLTGAERHAKAATIANAYVNKAEALAGQNETAAALALLDEGVAAWGAERPSPTSDTLKATYFDEEIARLKLVGQNSAAIVAPTWFNRAASAPMALAGHVTLLEFTAHWCGPCRESYPGINRLRARFGADGFQVVLATRLYGYFGADRDVPAAEELARDRAYFAEHHLADVPVAVGPRVDVKIENGRVRYVPEQDPNDVAYHVTGIPQIQLVDRHGTVRLIMVGYDDANEPRLAAMIESLLHEKQP